MKFAIRDGFVALIVTVITLGDDSVQRQENTYYGGQTVDLTAEQAEGHAHKLEPADKAAAAWLASKVPPQAPAAALGLSPEQLALMQTMASEMARAMLGHMQQPAAAPAA